MTGIELSRCHECGALTPLALLDGKPSKKAIAAYGSLENCADRGCDFERLLCQTCYGPGWAPTDEAPFSHQLANSKASA
jgi:hypothetical protein